MSEVQFDCPHCGLTLAIDAAYGGQESTCPTCGGAFIIPEMAAPPSPSLMPSEGGYSTAGQGSAPPPSAPAPGYGGAQGYQPPHGYAAPGVPTQDGPPQNSPRSAQGPRTAQGRAGAQPPGGTIPAQANPRRPQPIPTDIAGTSHQAAAPQQGGPRRPQPLNRPVPVAPGSAPAHTSPASPGNAAQTAPAGQPKRPSGVVTIPDPEGAGHYTVRDPVKTIRGASGEVVQLRSLTPEEKAARRFRRNLIMMAFGIVVLTIVVAILINLG